MEDLENKLGAILGNPEMMQKMIIFSFPTVQEL